MAPKLNAPVMRTLPVAEIARTVKFYRDVLGFKEIGDGELANGPARIELAVDPKPQPAIVFFLADDVSGLHAVIRSRGGKPSAIERVNWIKIEMFEIRDPDGHTLWFGQSFAEPVPAPPPPLLDKIMPELPLDDVAAGVAHYRDVLGFSINYQQHDIGVMDRDQVRVLLIGRTSEHKGIGSAYVYVEDADALHAELVQKGARVQGEPVSQPWGLREFRVLDPEGNRITFGQPFE